MVAFGWDGRSSKQIWTLISDLIPSVCLAIIWLDYARKDYHSSMLSLQTPCSRLDYVFEVWAHEELFINITEIWTCINNYIRCLVVTNNVLTLTAVHGNLVLTLWYDWVSKPHSLNEWGYLSYFLLKLWVTLGVLTPRQKTHPLALSKVDTWRSHIKGFPKPFTCSENVTNFFTSSQESPRVWSIFPRDYHSTVRLDRPSQAINKCVILLIQPFVADIFVEYAGSPPHKISGNPSIF